MSDSYKAKTTLDVNGKTYTCFSLKTLEKKLGADFSKLPFSIRVLLENLLRKEDGQNVSADDIKALAGWNPKEKSTQEIAFTPARVILQDFTGVPAVVDLAAMRDAIAQAGGDPDRINPLELVDLVIDHSVQVDRFGTADAFKENVDLEYGRNRERYEFLKWGQQAFNNFRVVPPGTGIIHQVNLEYLARVVFTKKVGDETFAYPDTLVGTDSHTTMINGLGVLGWGVGGIEAEAAMLGQPISMLIPQVVGFRLKGKLPEGVTATDAVLTVTQMLRAKGVVGKFVEYFGEGLDSMSLADRAILANMAPEYGATMGFVPVDEETLAFLKLSNRSAENIALVEAYCKEQKLFREKNAPDPEYSDVLELDLATVVPSLAGPKRPQDRVPLSEARSSFQDSFPVSKDAAGGGTATAAQVKIGTEQFELANGAVVIAAITSCTNTSNPSVMMAAGLVAKKAVECGLSVKPWVKTSLAPGSKVVMDYLEAGGLVEPLEALKFNLVGYGCTTCIGNSGPLPEAIAKAITENNLVASAVLSGNRNFEGRVNPHVRANYLASPPLVVAYALAGTLELDLTRDPIGTGSGGQPVFLKDIWPTQAEIKSALNHVKAAMFEKEYGNVFAGDDAWQGLSFPSGSTFAWDDQSTYVKNPPYFQNMATEAGALKDIVDARVLVMVGDSVTTDHISPAGAISKDSPAARYLRDCGVADKDFNSYGSRRGNHEIMMRGTFGNIRLRNQLAPGTEGGITRHLPDGKQTSIFEASEQYRQDGVPLIVIAGKEYGTGSSRDWAAKGPALLGVKAVIAESYERIHRSNLIGMGILPLQFEDGENRESLGLSGEETFSITGLAAGLAPGKKISVKVCSGDSQKEINVVCRIDTPVELEYYRHGGILHYVLRQLIQNG